MNENDGLAIGFAVLSDPDLVPAQRRQDREDSASECRHQSTERDIIGRPRRDGVSCVRGATHRSETSRCSSFHGLHAAYSSRTCETPVSVISADVCLVLGWSDGDAHGGGSCIQDRRPMRRQIARFCNTSSYANNNNEQGTDHVCLHLFSLTCERAFWPHGGSVWRRSLLGGLLASPACAYDATA